jgi:hypothetical protein
MKTLVDFFVRIVNKCLASERKSKSPQSGGALGALLSPQGSQPFKLCLNHVETHGDSVL